MCNSYFKFISDKDSDFSKLFDTSLLNFPSIFLFERGKYEIYNGITVLHALETFIHNLKSKLTKPIPSTKYITLPLWSQLCEYARPLTPLTELFEIGSTLHVVVGLIIIILPLLFLACFSLESNEETIEAQSDNLGNEDSSEDQPIQKYNRRTVSVYSSRKPGIKSRRAYTKIH